MATFAAPGVSSPEPTTQALGSNRPGRGSTGWVEARPVLPGGSTTTGPNFRGLAITPLPGSREELDMVRPNEAQLPPPEVRPVPGKPLPPGLPTR